MHTNKNEDNELENYQLKKYHRFIKYFLFVLILQF